ncbi:50S ribosomal protein L11 methyltransferase [Parapedobacter sp. 10938]|uniref:50S ribosomal protein L11 methyltransferase n=1 Tax=Parapedobacter flavus TaxID=3110225 RepID=UPI002DC0149B|nr:50S ribosomal protein L11 methyltransferase [Parapedobacter sp. 10938]MEC3880981.1 50S ribosomal protein L11 methyltransferase [Parapedobacter sp. 10938]
MRYSEVVFSCTGGEDWHQDILISDLGDLGFDTFETRDGGFAAYIASEQLDRSALESMLIHQPIGFEVSYVVNEIEPQNWNNVWERNFEPVVVADQCYVRATFHPAAPEYPYEIVIDPKMAFGTGHHQTTSLMMRQMLAETLAGKKVLDMGCGTGILAILAAKLGAEQVLAIDNDPVCVASVEENKIRNGVPHIATGCGSSDFIRGRRFDVILANINRNILLEQLEDYAGSLGRGGVLYMSGFYDGHDLGVLKEAAVKHRLVYAGHETMDSWAAALFIKEE